MKFTKYIKDNLFKIIIACISYGIILLVLFAYKVDLGIIMAISFILIVSFFSCFNIDFFRKKKFYTDLLCNIDSLDKSYLVLETLAKPEFYEGELLYLALYEINKSMRENIKKEEEQVADFKDYIEMWIHEVKIPLSTLVLMLNNHKNEIDKKINGELKKLENYVNQVLYYVRAENAEKDYLIKEIDLAKVIKNVGLKNMEEMLVRKIDFIVENVNYKVLTDSKWLEFILEQIINNSIKYKSDVKDSYIKIMIEDEEDKITIIILDNGIGIKDSDIKQVFNKSFTGENGRNGNSSTGMGLYIAKNLCKKLGHKIKIESKLDEYTKVSIIIAKNRYYDVLK